MWPIALLIRHYPRFRSHQEHQREAHPVFHFRRKWQAAGLAWLMIDRIAKTCSTTAKGTKNPGINMKGNVPIIRLGTSRVDQVQWTRSRQYRASHDVGQREQPQ